MSKFAKILVMCWIVMFVILASCFDIRILRFYAAYHVIIYILRYSLISLVLVTIPYSAVALFRSGTRKN
jgi:hypothetical protein